MDSYQAVRSISTVDQKFQISGNDCQILTISLASNQRIVSQPGALMFMSPQVKTEIECGNCFRLCVGETLCKTVFHNEGREDGFVALTPSFPAKVIPVDLRTLNNNRLIAKSGAYMSHIGEVHLTSEFDCCPTTCLCGGLGWARQALSGGGTVFLEAGGVVLTKTLGLSETIIVDSDAVVAFQDSVTLHVRPQSSLEMCCLGGEGCFNTTLTGPGLVILQSMSFNKFKAAVAPPQGHSGTSGDNVNAGGGGGSGGNI